MSMIRRLRPSALQTACPGARCVKCTCIPTVSQVPLLHSMHSQTDNQLMKCLAMHIHIPHHARWPANAVLPLAGKRTGRSAVPTSAAGWCFRTRALQPRNRNRSRIVRSLQLLLLVAKHSIGEKHTSLFALSQTKRVRMAVHTHDLHILI
jgi:hypothetical protein